MKSIPQIYNHAIYNMELQKREANVAVYKDKTRPYWEVHVVRVAAGREKFGKFYDEHEKLPSQSEFGVYAWACVTQERADARMNEAIAAGAGVP